MIKLDTTFKSHETKFHRVVWALVKFDDKKWSSPISCQFVLVFKGAQRQNIFTNMLIIYCLWKDVTLAYGQNKLNRNKFTF